MSTKKLIKKPLLNEILPHPDLPPIKFRIGQTVWQAETNWTSKNIICKVCNGKRNVTASIPNSNKVITSSCPECYGAGYINGDWRYYPNVVLLTICSIRVNTIISASSTDIVSYMMHETSDAHGSGTIHYQRNLFDNVEEAQIVAEKMCIDAMSAYEKTQWLGDWLACRL